MVYKGPHRKGFRITMQGYTFGAVPNSRAWGLPHMIHLPTHARRRWIQGMVHRSGSVRTRRRSAFTGCASAGSTWPRQGAHPVSVGVTSNQSRDSS